MPRLAVVPELETELDNLYGCPLEEFTAARNELASRLTKAGQADAADTVKGLKKPSVAVWAVNQLARMHEKEVAALIDAGARLRSAQESALRGGAADEVRAATRAERDALRTLTRRAEAVLSESGRGKSQQTLERINKTLRAAAVDPEASSLLQLGRLPDEVQSEGFGALAAMAPTRPTKKAARRKDGLALRRLRREAEEAERAATEAEEEAKRAADDAAHARERAKAARRDARQAAKALAAEERRE